jgi:probable rRNA maturation factor
MPHRDRNAGCLGLCPRISGHSPIFVANPGKAEPFRTSAGKAALELRFAPSGQRMIEVVNRQRKMPLDCERWQTFATKAMRVLPDATVRGAGVTVAFVSDRAMRELNRLWRHKRGTTDVLSFPAEQDEFETADGVRLGDVVISVEQAARQAKENSLTFDEEIAQLILHGLIHLCGYDHATDKGEMNRLELRLRKRLGL